MTATPPVPPGHSRVGEYLRRPAVVWWAVVVVLAVLGYALPPLLKGASVLELTRSGERLQITLDGVQLFHEVVSLPDQPQVSLHLGSVFHSTVYSDAQGLYGIEVVRNGQAAHLDPNEYSVMEVERWDWWTNLFYPYLFLQYQIGSVELPSVTNALQEGGDWILRLRMPEPRRGLVRFSSPQGQAVTEVMLLVAGAQQVAVQERSFEIGKPPVQRLYLGEAVPVSMFSVCRRWLHRGLTSSFGVLWCWLALQLGTAVLGLLLTRFPKRVAPSKGESWSRRLFPVVLVLSVVFVSVETEQLRRLLPPGLTVESLSVRQAATQFGEGFLFPATTDLPEDLAPAPLLAGQSRWSALPPRLLGWTVGVGQVFGLGWPLLSLLGASALLVFPWLAWRRWGLAAGWLAWGLLLTSPSWRHALLAFPVQTVVLALLGLLLLSGSWWPGLPGLHRRFWLAVPLGLLNPLAWLAGLVLLRQELAGIAPQRLSRQKLFALCLPFSVVIGGWGALLLGSTAVEAALPLPSRWWWNPGNGLRSLLGALIHLPEYASQEATALGVVGLCFLFLLPHPAIRQHLPSRWALGAPVVLLLAGCLFLPAYPTDLRGVLVLQLPLLIAVLSGGLLTVFGKSDPRVRAAVVAGMLLVIARQHAVRGWRAPAVQPEWAALHQAFSPALIDILPPRKTSLLQSAAKLLPEPERLQLTPDSRALVFVKPMERVGFAGEWTPLAELHATQFLPLRQPVIFARSATPERQRQLLQELRKELGYLDAYSYDPATLTIRHEPVGAFVERPR